MTSLRKLDTTHNIFSIEQAHSKASELRGGDPDWEYRVVENPNKSGPKTAVIKIYDEDGEFVANF